MKSRSKRVLKNSNKILLLFVVLVLLIFVFWFMLKRILTQENITNIYLVEKDSNLFYNLEIVRIPARALVFSPEENLTLGFSNDPNILDFGIIPGNGSYSKKYLQLENYHDIKVKVEVKTLGNISSKIIVKNREFWLGEKEKTNLEIIFFTNETLSGYYEGEVRVYIKIPKHEIVYSIDKFFGWFI